MAASEASDDDEDTQSPTEDTLVKESGEELIQSELREAVDSEAMGAK